MRSKNIARDPARSKPRGHQHGFTLVEILVTLVVLSIGLLGVASMQLSGLKQSKGSLQATQATAFAYALADLMRANKAGISGYLVSSSGFSSLPVPPTNCASTTCTAADLAAYDLYYWFNNYSFTDASSTVITVPGVQSVLGAGATAWVKCADSSNPMCYNSATAVYHIGVFWDKSRGASPATATSPCMSSAGNDTGKYDPNDTTQLACVVISVQL